MRFALQNGMSHMRPLKKFRGIITWLFVTLNSLSPLFPSTIMILYVQ